MKINLKILVILIILVLPFVNSSVDWENGRYPNETFDNLTNWNSTCTLVDGYLNCANSQYAHYAQQLPNRTNGGNVTCEFQMRVNSIGGTYATFYVIGSNQSGGGLTGQTWSLPDGNDQKIHLRDVVVGNSAPGDLGITVGATQWNKMAFVFEHTGKIRESAGVYVNGSHKLNLTLASNQSTDYWARFSYASGVANFDIDNFTCYNGTYLTGLKSNLVVNASDYFDGTKIFNLTLRINNNSYEYTASDGIIAVSNLTEGTYNITISTNDSYNYFNLSMPDFVINGNVYTAKLWQAIVYINASEIISGLQITGFGARVNASTIINLSNSTGFATLRLKAGQYNITVNSTPYQNGTANFTINALEEKNITVELGSILLKLNSTYIVTGLSVNNFSIRLYKNNSDYTINKSTSDGTIFFPIINGSYLLEFMSDVAGVQNTTLNANTTLRNHNYTFLVYSLNSINISIFDEFLGKPNKILFNTTFELTADTFSSNYTSTNGSLFLELNPETYRISYEAQGFRRRSYYFKLTNGTHADIDLYLLSTGNGTLTTFSFVDSISNPATNKTVQALRYYVNVNSYLIVAMALTDSLGQAQFDLEHNDAFYQFLVFDEGDDLVYSSNGNVIFQTSYSDIQISAASDTFGSIQKGTIVYRNLSFSNISNTISFKYTDTTGLGAQACLIADRISLKESVNLCHTCVTSSSSTILCDVNSSISTNYTVIAKALIYETTNNNNTATILDVLTISPNNLIQQTKDVFGTYGVFISGVFIMGIVGVGLFSVAGGVTIAILGFVVTYLLGLFTMGANQLMWLVGIIILGGIIIVKSR